MMRIRTIFLSISLVVVLLFAGLLMASRSSRDGLFRALGNLAEVVHLVETQYVDELNQEALSLSLDAGLVESQDHWAAVLPPELVDDYLELVKSPPPFGLGVASRIGSAAVRFVLSGSPAEATTRLISSPSTKRRNSGAARVNSDPSADPLGQVSERT